MKTLLVYMPLSWPMISSRVFKSFIDLLSPENQKVLSIERDIELKVMISGTFPLDRNRNEAVDLAVTNKYEADYIFFADADNIWPKDTLFKLLEHISDEFPVVSGLYFRKSPPYSAVPGHYSDWEKHEMQRRTLKEMGFVDAKGNQCAFYRPVKDFETVQPIDVSGMGCLLVQAEVFKKLEMPVFRYHNPYSLGGDFSIQHMSEEMEFFCKLHKAGIKALLVPQVRCGHEVLRVVGCAEE